jgi:hypothetical protein
LIIRRDDPGINPGQVAIGKLKRSLTTKKTKDTKENISQSIKLCLFGIYYADRIVAWNPPHDSPEHPKNS